MILVSTSTLDFGRVTVGQDLVKSITVFNTNIFGVNITVASLDGVYVPVPTPVLIPPNDSVIVNTTFSPIAVANYPATLTIVNDDPNDLSDDVITILGQGIKATIESSVTELDYETVAVLDSKELSVVILNTAIDGLLTVSNITSDNAEIIIIPTNFTLNPSQTREVKITFNPTVAATELGVITVTNDSSNDPILAINAQGQGVEPTISIDKTALAFDDVTINTSKILDVIVSNISTEDVNIVITSVITDNVRFKESISTFVIEKDSALNIPVSFTPIDTSSQVGKLIITSNAGVDEVDLTGQGTATPNISVSTNFLNYGNVGLGNSSNKKFSISNSGVVDLNVSQIFSDNTKFVASPLSATISPSGILEVTVIYSPTEPLIDNGTLLVVSNDPDTPNVSINVGGEGISPTLQTATNLNFGNVAVDSTSSQSLTITNSENAELVISSITFSNAKFSSSEVFPLSVGAKSSKILSINFSPDSVGTEVSDLTLFSNDFINSETVVSLNGIGTVPNIAINPSSIDFGNLIINGTRERSIVVSNVGEATLVISSISISNPAFSVPISSFTVLPSQSQNLDITFAPTSLGSQVGTITLINNDPDEANLIINVQGVGGKPTVSIDKTAISFGGTAINTTLTDQVVATNFGNVDLEINNAINPPGVFGVTPSSRTISPAISEILSVTFIPNVLGVLGATLNIGTNDPDNPLLVVNLDGSGVQAPSISISSSTVNFPETIAGQTSSNALGITNAGTADLIIDTITIASNPTFIVTATPPITITPGNSTSLTIIFTPSSAGSFLTTMTLTTNDINNPSLDIQLTGTATAAILAWEDYSLDNIVPQALVDVANRVNEVIGPISDALEFVNSILEIVKIFIIDIQDPVKIILEAIKALLTKLINDIAGTGLYFLQVFPGNFKIGPLHTPQYLLGVPLDLTDPDNLPQKIKDKYKSQIDEGIPFVSADAEDMQLVFGPTEDFFSNIKGGSATFKNKILQSFDDPGDSKRPQFSDDASVGAIILAVDTEDLVNFLKLINQIYTILKIKFEAQFLPPTNVTAIASSDSVRITFSPNDALLPNAWILWRSEVQGGAIQYEESAITNAEEGEERIPKKDEQGNIIKRYDLIKVITLQDQLAEIFNVSTDTANGMVKNAFGYIRGVLGNAEQFFSAKFTTEDTKDLETGKSYFYTLTAANVVDPNDTSEITNKIEFSDDIIRVLKANKETERKINPFDVGLYANSTYSTEVSASPDSAFNLVEGSLARCRNYRCSTGKETTEDFPPLLQADLNTTLNLTLSYVPLISTLDISVEKTSSETGGFTVVDIPRSDYNVKDRIVTFLKTNFFELNDKITTKYSYREILKSEAVTNERHTISGIIGDDFFITFNTKKTPIVDDINSISGTIFGSITITKKEILNANTGKIKLELSAIHTGSLNISVNYEYYPEFQSDENFICVNPEFAKYYFDVVKCDNGTTLCPGYENRNCFFNSGDECTNTGISTRRITIAETDANGGLTGRRVVQPENIPFKNFWDAFYCQNGIMAQRCDGYSIGAPRAGYKGVPPDWSRIAIIDLFPDIKEAIKALEKFINGLLAGTTKIGDTLIAFIELIQRKIQGLQDFLSLIQNILTTLAENFSGGGFYILKVPIGEGGNAYLKESISKATGGPTSDVFGYTGGIVIVYGGPGGATLDAALDIFF